MRQHYPSEGQRIQARLQGRTRKAIISRAFALKLKTRPPGRRMTRYETDLLEALYLACIPPRRIAQVLGASPSAVRHSVVYLGLTEVRELPIKDLIQASRQRLKPPEYRRGRGTPPALQALIRELYVAGVPPKRIADEIGMLRVTVRNYVLRHGWLAEREAACEARLAGVLASFERRAA